MQIWLEKLQTMSMKRGLSSRDNGGNAKSFGEERSLRMNRDLKENERIQVKKKQSVNTD